MTPENSVVVIRPTDHSLYSKSKRTSIARKLLRCTYQVLVAILYKKTCRIYYIILGYRYKQALTNRYNNERGVVVVTCSSSSNLQQQWSWQWWWYWQWQQTVDKRNDYGQKGLRKIKKIKPLARGTKKKKNSY